jgi:hypothetical protein
LKGSIFINSNLPRRLQPQDESEGALNSLPQRRNHSVTLGPVNRPVFQEIFTDSTDYAVADTLGQEASCYIPSSPKTRPGIELYSLPPIDISRDSSFPIGNELSMEPEVSDEMRCLASVEKIGTVSMVE